MTDKLLPCPFCGGTTLEYKPWVVWWAIHCENCGTVGPNVSARKEAVEKWNLRAQIEAPTPGNLLLEEDFIVSASEYNEFMEWCADHKAEKS